MPLKYPLHYYDDTGRLKPTLFVFFLLLFVCRGLIILIFSLSFREDSERILRFFYPEPYHFYLSLIPILPALFALYLVSRRTILWEKNKYKIFKLLPIIMAAALIADAAMQVQILWKIHFAFSLSHGVPLVICLLGLIYIVKSKYIKNLVNDWKTPT
jgi:hypothetical protein